MVLSSRVTIRSALKNRLTEAFITCSHCAPLRPLSVPPAQNIVKGKYSWPSHVKDKEMKDVVSKVLVRTVTNRLGCRKDGITEVMEHKFFAPIDWKTLLAKRVRAPWLPPVKDAFDAGCFDKYEGPEDITPYVDDGTSWDAEF